MHLIRNALRFASYKDHKELARPRTQTIHNSLSNAPNSPSSVPKVARQRSPTQITALGNLPNAVIREPVTSSVGHDVLSGIVRPLGLAFLLLDVRHFLS